MGIQPLYSTIADRCIDDIPTVVVMALRSARRMAAPGVSRCRQIAVSIWWRATAACHGGDRLRRDE
ncbi:hypothetical protein [Sphingomonas sp. TZW2008]|uniref:hypothetical protein n=1 Tax=Sphingomonas sp. TZW2008 TaxID=1917973 RepID=UPI0015C51940|nr:hypothetical protein [Sphingomonas sp. TZW2008]